MAYPTVLYGEQARHSPFSPLRRSGTAAEFLDQSLRRSPGPALGSDQRSRRLTDKLQILSWNPGPPRGLYPRAVADHLNGPWHIICIPEGAGFVTDSSLAENIHLATQRRCAALLNKDTFARDFTCSPIQIPCSLRYSSWAVERVVVTGKFRRAQDPFCSSFTIANLHINNECVKRRSICIALLLHIRDLCMKLGAVILTGNFNKAVKRETLSGDSGDRRISPIEAAFSHANIPWPTSGVTPLWRLAASPTAAHCPNAAGSLSCPSHRVSCVSCATGPSTLSM